MNNALKNICIASVVFLLACQKEEIIISEILRPVRTMVIEHPDSGKVMQYAAVVDASQKADLSFKVSGELIHIYVRQGDDVKKNQILAKLNDTDIKLSLAEAQSSFDKSKADYDRGTALMDSNVISNADMDKLRALYSSASTRLESAQNNLEYTNLYASFDGVIAKKYTENFQEITAKQSVFALHNITEIHLKINVPESVIIQIPRNDTSHTIFAVFDDIPNQTFPAEFKEVSLQADEFTKTYEVTFTMESPQDHTILPGMTAILRGTQRLTSENKNKRFYLPSNSVLKDNAGNFVYVVEGTGDGKGVVKKLPVSIGEITSEGIEVFFGIKTGDHLVTAGVSKISDGMIVKFTINN
jgi:RND family efflux transporter MFP subunit